VTLLTVLLQIEKVIGG